MTKLNIVEPLGKDKDEKFVYAGDLVTFKKLTGKALGVHKDGRLQIECVEEKETTKGIRTYRYVWLIPFTSINKS